MAAREGVFQAVVERPPEKRPTFLAALTSDDDALRREIESLLASDASDAGFLDQLPIASESDAPILSATLSAAMDHAVSHRPHRWSSSRSLRSRRPARCGRHGRMHARATRS